MSDQLTPAERYICIHGHFYQPPRENPWLETVETEDSAAPYHDWNERITAECYAPNGASRIVNGENQIIRIMNNYSRISFNFGPTLLSWLEENAPRTYRMIRDADRQSMLRYDSHGSAMAQVYNHVIMPLAVTREQYLTWALLVAAFGFAIEETLRMESPVKTTYRLARKSTCVVASTYPARHHGDGRAGRDQPQSQPLRTPARVSARPSQRSWSTSRSPAAYTCPGAPLAQVEAQVLAGANSETA